MNYEKALKLATKTHKGQKRKDGKEYITHPLAVASKFEDETHKIVAVLHDVVEDCDITVRNLYFEHHFGGKTCDAIYAISKRKNQSYIDFILQVKKNPIATAVKIEDLKHNLSDLKKGNLREKYLMALWILGKIDKMILCAYCSKKSVIAGQAFTKYQCEWCDKTFLHPNTNTPRVCPICAERENICQRCAHDIESVINTINELKKS